MSVNDTIIVLFCKEKKSIAIGVPGTRIEVYDKEMLNIIDSNAVFEILADGFKWSEGPFWLENEQKVIFTDVPENTIFSWDSIHGKQTYLKPSGYTIINKKGGTEGANV
ncbi:MAG: hypothetical protein IPO92_18140 [Saprospiraceae bacterium]|nr:hypothetical protein [Saprospiraceae bacterium]